ncbi:uncharacterized protein [Panulirus ornatus]|uniref:uncharacterized protein isoform X2 n=1 Tax=Panulirus ornatus TaxID=150431 RepID=UPI003A8BAC9D
MATLGQLVANSLWFAFDALDHQKTGVVPKSQLKVLTQNVGVLLKIERRVENCIAEYLSCKQLNFEQYLYFLTHEVTLNNVEVREVTRHLVMSLGREWDIRDFNQVATAISCFTFPVFLTFLEGRYAQDTEYPALERAVDDVYSSFIEQVLKRGKVYQRVWWAPIWVRRDIELRPWAMFASIHKVKARSAALSLVMGRAQVCLTPSATVHNIPDEPSARMCRFTLCLESNKLIQLAASDHRSKTEWLRVLDAAIHHSKETLPYQAIMSAIRKNEHAEEEARETAERIRRDSQADIIENTQAELMAEKLARAQAEAAAREEAAARKAEEKRVLELQTLRRQLETLLEEETQAKRDEEIVRNLQARVLSEEWERREELERLQAEQRRMLEEETKKRQAFERQQEEKDSQLREAEKRLKKLESERLKLDHELRSAREKIIMSERGKELLEARMKVKERTPPVRTYSLRPLRKERGTAPARSSSFNTHAARLFKFRSKNEDNDNGSGNSNGTVESN